MIAYRVAKQPFQINEEIPPGHALSDLSADKQAVEQLLEECRPESKPCRTDTRYVFKEKDAALAWAKDSLNRKLYVVVVEDEDILHEGDWAWVGKILGETDTEIKKSFANKYWTSEKSENPTVELIISKAKVVEIDGTISPEEQHETVRKKLGLPNLDELFGNRTSSE